MGSKDCTMDPQRKGGSLRSSLPGSLSSFPPHWNLLFHVGLAWSESRTQERFAQGWQSCSLKSEPIRLPMETWKQTHQEKFSNTFILVAYFELWWKALMRENTVFLLLKIIKILMKKHWFMDKQSLCIIYEITVNKEGWLKHIRLWLYLS